MKNFGTFLFGLICLGVILGIFVSIVDNTRDVSFEQGYKQACIDFYKGKIKYDLIKNEDGTVEWKKIGKIKK